MATVHGGAGPLPLQTDLRQGTTLAGYRLEEVVGRGGMGVVYRACHLLLGRTAALKLLLPHAAADPAFRDRFVRESRMAAALEHPNVVPIYDAGEQDGLLYIAMRYVDGTNLDALLESEGALDPQQALRIAEQIGSALDAAHARSIVHRDVKPANVLLDDRGAYLSDFGLTKQISSKTRLTAHGQFVGTIEYMPPEQIEGRRLEPASDEYALGCVLYHALTGAPPFQRPDPVSLMYAQLHDRAPAASGRRHGLPPELDDVFERALAKRSEERFGSCLDLVGAARAALGLEGDAAPAAPVARRKTTTVLVAAGDSRLRAAVRGLLGSERYLFAESGSAEETLEALRAERPQVVVLDWRLTDAPRELCSALRAELAEIKIVALARRDEAPDGPAQAEAGVDGLVLWPPSGLQLQLKFAELLADRAPTVG